MTRHYTTTADTCRLHRSVELLAKRMLQADEDAEWPGKPVAVECGRVVELCGAEETELAEAMR
jgi:hypothetical protein